jgi:ribonuclease HII
VLYFERKLRSQGFDLIIGVDEAGRGPLAGPVVAAAVALKTTRFKNRIDDSKKLSPLLRDKAFPEIMEKSYFGLGVVGEKTIDRVNILVASRLAMEKAVRSLIAKTPSLRKRRVHIIVDGNMAINTKFFCTPIIKGDGRSKSIAAASILAKVTRDKLMNSYDRVYPQYGFLKHKGYPTKEHRLIIRKIGICKIHRKSFCQCLSRA